MFLVADNCGFITGSTLSINGGPQCIDHAANASRPAGCTGSGDTPSLLAADRKKMWSGC